MLSRVQWLPPAECEPPHGITHETKVHQLAVDFLTGGWDPSQPALIGYPCGEKIQLLSGSHRHAAAVIACINIPVVVRPRWEIAAAWGNVDAWQRIMELGMEAYRDE